MKLGKVIGNVWATKKDPRLNGQKLLLVDLDSEIVVAADIIGAGVDDMVLLVNGTAARISTGNESTPVDLSVVGIIDSIEKNR